jgi:hypothetical protein
MMLIIRFNERLIVGSPYGVLEIYRRALSLLILVFANDVIQRMTCDLIFLK